MARRSQQLLLAFLGACVVDRHDVPISTSQFIEVLAPQGIGKAAVRASLTRMVERGLLSTTRVGRDRSYALTEAARDILRRAGVRVRAHDPFDPPGSGWTLLSYTVPESRRELRHQLRARLSWAGFGLLRDGLWIASGRANLDEIFRNIEGREQIVVNAFTCKLVKDWVNPEFVREAWDLTRIAEAHRDFISQWSEREREGSALTSFTALIADWLQLLRMDPRLPSAHLPDDWPAATSVGVFRRAHAALEVCALNELSEKLRSAQPDPGTRESRVPPIGPRGSAKPVAR